MLIISLHGIFQRKGIILQLLNIGKYKGQDCYSIIDEKIKKAVDSLLPRFEKAMEKGIIHHPYGINGVKFLKENAVAIKINAGKRILTDKIYENTRHELLINFDYETNPKGAEVFINGHHLEICSTEGL